MTLQTRLFAWLLTLALVAAACSGSPTATTDLPSGEPGVMGETTTPAGKPSPDGNTQGDGLAAGVGAPARERNTPGPDAAEVEPHASGEEIYAGEVGVSEETVTIGYIYAKTGPISALVRHVESAVQGAAAEINAKGGINGRDVVVLTGDDGYNNASTALATATGMKDKVFGITTFGLLASTVIAPWADENRVPTIVGNFDRATGLKMTYVFTPSTFLETSAEILPSFIEHRLKKGNEPIGIIYQATPQVAIIREHFRAAAKEFDQEVVIEQEIAESPSTCANEAANVQDAGARVVLLFTSPIPAIQCLKDAELIGYAPTWTGVGPSFNFNVTNTASGGLTEGIEMLANMRTLESNQGKRYAAVMRARYPDSGADEDDFGLLAWAQMHLWFEALRRAGPNLTRDGFVQAMETMDGWKGGLFAPTRFAPGKRFGPRATIIVKAVNRRWVTVDEKWRRSY